MTTQHRTRRALTAAAWVTLAGIATPAGAINLLVNPGFEAPPATGQPLEIAGWTPFGDPRRASFFNHTPGGQWSIWGRTFVPIGGGYTQNQSVIAGQSYDFSAFLYVEAGFLTITDPVSADMSLTWLDGGGSPIGSPHAISIAPADNPAIATWIPLSLNGLVAPAGTAQARVSFGWSNGGPGSGGQSIFWDDVVLDGPGTPPTNAWVVDNSGNYNVQGNWALGSVPNGVDVTAEFAGVITAPRTVFTDANVTVGTLTMSNANTYNLTGAGSMTLQTSSGSARINVGQGVQKINLHLHLGSNTTADVANGATLLIADPLFLNGRTLTKTGQGTMLIEAPVRSGSPAEITVSNGEARFNFGVGTPATPTTPADGKVTVNVTGSKATFDADQTLAGLNVATANPGDQEVDLLASKVRVYTADRAAAELAIYNAIRDARNSSSGRDGIYSSLDDAGTNFSVGVTDQSLDARGDLSVLVRLTRTGDANVDGITNIGDFSLLGANFNLPGRWDNGDFNYDGVVNIGDFSLLAANFNQSASDVSARGSAVPEPAALGLLGLAALGVARRRRVA